MSTKTTIKRIALVAVAALALGTFSYVPANAAGTALTSGNAIIFAWTGDGLSSGDNGTSAYDSTNQLGLKTGAGVAGPVNTVTTKVQFDAGDGTANTKYNDGSGTKRAIITVSGAGATILSGGTVNTAGTQSVIAANNAATDVIISTPTAGTVTVSVYQETASSGIFSSTAAETVTWTVASTASSGVFSAALSSVFDTTTVGSAATAALTTVPSVLATPGTARVRYTISLADALGAELATKKVTATLSGPGLVAADSDTIANAGRSATNASAAATQAFYVYGDGSSGTTTVTFTVGTSSLATKSISFYSSTVATLEVTANNNYVAVAAVSGYTAAGKVIKVVAKDSNGNVIPSLTNLTATSSDTAVANAGSMSSAYDSTDKAYYVPITAVAAGTATITVKDSTGTISGSAVVNVTKAVASSVKLALESYTAGEMVTATLTALDSSGNPVADGTYTAFLSGKLSTSQAVTSDVFAANVTFVAGKATSDFYAPNSPSLKLTATLSSAATVATAIQATDVTTSATGTSPSSDAVDAANDAVEAANAATDAANAAAEAADAATAAAQDAQAAVADLAAQVATLISGIKAQITRLTNLVIKIQKKVRA